MQNDSNHEVVEIIDSNTDVLRLWNPSVGDETYRLNETRNGMSAQDRRLVLSEATRILSRCVPPSEPPMQRTGLVIGYVQSGKTMSFTTVAALARDNGYPLVIIVAGTSLPLLEQSTFRLKTDLLLDSRDDRKWRLVKSSELRVGDYQSIRNVLEEWVDDSVPVGERKTVLVTVLKNHSHLKKIIALLRSVKYRERIPTLIIDDEADQASLNVKVNQDGESSTYSRLLELKQLLPHHTFIQYTATPQAPLLINMIDVLSPRFVEVLTPGEWYTGGKAFFVDSNGLVKPIPPGDIPSKHNELIAPPDSLLDALRIFFIGVACGLAVNQLKGRNRSMLVHPTQKTSGHSQYFSWITKIQDRWKRTFTLPITDFDHIDLKKEFKDAYDDLSKTVTDLPVWNIVEEKLLFAIRRTQVKEINASRGKTPEITWNDEYSWILVGGQAMDRGFTIEGLTVTYMPRGAGTSNADTIQQRARFFGYKSGYKGYCRLYLELDVIQAFKSYIEHEEDIRSQLVELSRQGRPLSDWKRAFVLDINLNPTRSSVIDIEYWHERRSDQWFRPVAPHDNQEAINTNREILAEFLKMIKCVDDQGNSLWNQEYTNDYCSGLSLQIVMEHLLVPWRVTRQEDSKKNIAALLQLGAFLRKTPSAKATIYRMNHGDSRMRTTTNEEDKEVDGIQIFQGRSPSSKGGYPGDSMIYDREVVTVQIHRLEIRRARSGETIEDVPALAIWLPKVSSFADYLVQPQGGN